MQYLGSEPLGLAKSDWIKILKGMAVAGSAAALTWLASTGIPYLKDQPGANLLLCFALSTLVNMGRKFLADTTQVVIDSEESK